jgi:glycosyltransferase involved in cell wall biosynthesis
VPPGVPIVLCLGNIAPGRGVEQLCLAMGEVPDAVVVFVGPGGAFRDRIVSWAAGLPGAGRIRFLPAVGPRDIPALTADADVAAIVIQPTTLNHRLTTPTRLFDAMGAGLPVVASDLPGIAAIVRDAGMGVLCDPTDPSTIATALVDLLGATPERRLSFRSAGLAAARGRYSWSRQVEAVLGVYASLGIVLADRPTAPPTRQSGPARGPRLP